MTRGLLTAHRRYDPLTDEWVLVSPGRVRRPWGGGTERKRGDREVAYDPSCYLCPSNLRVTGQRNPDYRSTHVFDNDFSALRGDANAARWRNGLLRGESESGTCRVICYTPRHDLPLSLMSLQEIGAVIDVWSEQTASLGSRYRWVQVFENRGEAMGASNPHPHGQIWAGSALPSIPSREDAAQGRYFRREGSSLLLDYLGQEEGGPRMVVDGDQWVALVPYWATWPYGTLLVPRVPIRRISEVTGSLRDSLAVTLQELMIRYDNLFEYPFPYSMGWHGAPFDGGDTAHWQLHAHFHPPLLRSPSIRKFMVGYELLAEPQRDFTPEEAASHLRVQSRVHWRNR